jgi:hypothetical protein
VGSRGRSRAGGLGDALYLKCPDSVVERLAGMDLPEREREMTKLVSMCLLYGIGDYAL